MTEDLQRFQQEEAVKARPASTIYRLRLFSRRRQSLLRGVGIVAAIFLVLALGTAIIAKVSRQRDFEAFEARRSDTQGILTAISSPGEFDPVSVSQLRNLDRSLEIVTPLYERMRSYYPPSADMPAELASIYRRRGWMEAVFGNKDEALRLIEAALAIVEKLVKGPSALAIYRADLADTYSDLGTLHSLRKEWNQAQAACEAAIAERKLLIAGNTPSNNVIADLASDYLALSEIHLEQRDRAEADVAIHLVDRHYRGDG